MTRRDDQVIDGLTPSPNLLLQANVLREMVAIAADPTAIAKSYVQATRIAVRAAHALYREFCAMECRENWKRSAALPPQPRTTYLKDGCYYDTADVRRDEKWTGD
jgi:hypothetical protein